MSERQLVWAMRAREPEAIQEFFARFHSGLRRLAQLYRVPPAERENCVVDFLNDAALELIESARPIPRKLAAYLAVSFRHRRQNALRADARAERRTGEATDESPASGEAAVFAVCSERALRASRGPGWEAPPLSGALERLARSIEEELSTDERLLLVWAGNSIPLRQVAEWLGIDRSAAKLRVWRLRARLHKAARAYVGTLAPAERAELERFFRRAAAPDGPKTFSTGGRAQQGVRAAAQDGGHTVTRRRQTNERA